MPTYTVKAGVDANALNPTSSRKVTRLLDGTIFVVYTQSDGVRRQVYVSYSIDNGVSWTEEQVSFAAGANHQDDPTIATDSLDQVHVAWHGTGWGVNVGLTNIQYRMRNAAGAWQAQEGVTDLAFGQVSPAIAIDSVDTVHLVWESWGGISANAWPNIVYNQRVVAWGAAEQVTNNMNLNYNPAIAIDSTNACHVVWDRGNNGEILYRRRNGAWGAAESVDVVAQAVLNPTIAVDSLDNPHVAWYYTDWAITQSIRYARRNGAWGAFENVCLVAGQNNFNPGISIDLSDRVHVCWTGDGWGANPATYNLLHAIRATPWPAPDIIVDNANTNGTGNLLWAQDPPIGNPNIPLNGYMVVYRETTGVPVSSVMIILSSDLSFIVAPSVTTDPATNVVPESGSVNGTLDDDGGVACDCGFEWGETVAYGNTTPTQSRTTGQTFSQNIGGLSPGTTYHFRAFATNVVGTSYGADMSFTTPAVLPTVTTLPATGIT